MRLEELSAALKGFLSGDPHIEVTWCGSLERAAKGAITYIEHRKYLPLLANCRASAVIVPPEVQANIPSIMVERPLLAFARAVDILHHPERKDAEIHPSAVIHPSARIGKRCSVGPFSGIGPRSVLGNDVEISSCVSIGEHVTIGEGSVIFPNVVIYPGTTIGSRAIIHGGCVIGADGFKYVNDEDEVRRKVRHIGTVRIGNDVEIGANSCIDRAALDETVIGNGVKMDNLVQVGHNCVIGENTVIAGGCGLAGSSRIGKNVILGGQVGVRDHVRIADNVVIAAKSGVTQDLDHPGFYSGMPAVPLSDWRRQVAAVSRGPETLKRLTKLEKKTGETESGGN